MAALKHYYGIPAFTPYKKQPTQEFILSRSMPEPNTGCWFWLGRVDEYGYGHWRAYPNAVKAHRLSYALFKGPIPPGMHVLHSCDQPGCVNPDHLRVGTAQDNSDDKVRRNRQMRGRGAWKAKLTEEQVRSIYADKRQQKVIAAEYGVTENAVQAIRAGYNWKHVTGGKHA